MSNVIRVLLAVIYAHLSVVSGEFKCYSCVMSGGAPDTSCLSNPASVSTSSPVVLCRYKYCTIERQEYSDFPGEINTFYRGCTSSGYQGITEGGGFKVYTSVCTSNLCNVGDGIISDPSFDGGGSGGGGSGGGGSGGGSGGSGNIDPGYGVILYVKGIGNSGARGAEFYVTTFTILVLLILLR